MLHRRAEQTAPQAPVGHRDRRRRRPRCRDREPDPMKKTDLQSMFVSRQRSFVASQWPFASGQSGVAPVPQRCVTAQRQRAPRPQASAAWPTSYVMLHLPLVVAATGHCWLTNSDCEPVFRRISPCFLACRPYLVVLWARSRVGAFQPARCGLQTVLVHSFTTRTRRYPMPRFSRTEPEIAVAG